MAPAGLPAGKWGFPGLQTVNAALIGKDQQSVFAETGDDQLRRVFVLGGDTFEALPPTVLHTEHFNRHVADVIVLT